MPVFLPPSPPPGLHFLIYKKEQTRPVLPKDGSRCYPGVKQQLLEGPHSPLGAGKRFGSERKICQGPRLLEVQGDSAALLQTSPIGGPTELSFLLNEPCSLLCSAAAALGPAPVQERSPDVLWDTGKECPAGALWPSSGPGMHSCGEEVSRRRGLHAWLEHGNSTSGSASAIS